VTVGPTVRAGWPELASEAAGLGLFMISALVATALFEHPASPMFAVVTSELGRRAAIGALMGATAIAIITSPLGARSGGHLNPSVSLTFWRLGRIPGDTAWRYAIAQTVGGAVGVGLVLAIVPAVVRDASVNYVVTEPGAPGLAVALLGEAAISFLLMLIVLVVSASPRLAPRTPLVAGALVCLFIVVEAPYSGMSMNPARTIASAVWAGQWRALWLYLLVPPAAMLLAAELYVRVRGPALVGCARLHHPAATSCPHCALVPEPTRRAMELVRLVPPR
jgi:aquaporin Z